MTEVTFAASARPRLSLIALEWPLTFNGKLFEHIQLVRMTAGDVTAFQEKIAKAADDAKVMFPIFRDAEGSELPTGLLEALDSDDRDTINAAALDFLPRRFRGVGANASVPENGAPTA